MEQVDRDRLVYGALRGVTVTGETAWSSGSGQEAAAVWFRTLSLIPSSSENGCHCLLPLIRWALICLCEICTKYQGGRVLLQPEVTNEQRHGWSFGDRFKLARPQGTLLGVESQAHWVCASLLSYGQRQHDLNITKKECSCKSTN